uniref:Lipoprotein n=1 Tax=Ochrobactrum phage ORM_20 TaxID=2985243 RepID=A0A9N6WU38_9VIRU|nr:lipoprotein [Ochrobactrum phage ORM_20]
MKTLFRILAIGFMALAITACSKVPAGYVGVKVYLLGSDKGVDTEVLSPGRHWIGWNEDLYQFPTFTQNFTWEGKGANGGKSFTFQTIEGMVVSADVGVSYSVMPEKVSTIFQKYRRGIDEITDTYVKNMIRDAIVTEASRIRVESVYGSGKEDLIKAVEKRVRDQISPIGLNIERIYWVGQFDLPPEVIEKINAKVNADQITQQKIAELEQTRADAQKRIAEAEGEKQAAVLRAQGEAEANRVVTESINETLIRYRQTEKWDGVLPKVTSGATPFVKID